MPESNSHTNPTEPQAYDTRRREPVGDVSSSGGINDDLTFIPRTRLVGHENLERVDPTHDPAAAQQRMELANNAINDGLGYSGTTFLQAGNESVQAGDESVKAGNESVQAGNKSVQVVDDDDELVISGGNKRKSRKRINCRPNCGKYKQKSRKSKGQRRYKSRKSRGNKSRKGKRKSRKC